MNELRVTVQPGTGYDLLMSAALLANPEASRRLDATRAVRQRGEAIGDGSLVEVFERIGREPFLNLLGFVNAMTEEPTAENALAAIAAADPLELHLTIAGYYRRAFRITTPPTVIRAAIGGDESAIAEFKRTSYPHVGHWQGSLRNMLGRSHEDVHAELAGALRQWLVAGFTALEPEIEARLAADVAVVRPQLADADLDTMLQRLVPGITFARELGNDLIVLTPSVLVKPGFALADYGTTMVIVYPAAGHIEGSDKPPDRLVRLTKAMGDELRLRALRELRDGPMVATELAKRLGVPRTTIHHHVSILINAGLVRMAVDDARTGNIQLRPEAVAELTELAQAWLLGRVQSTDGRERVEES
jgi:DNA-binding transcriptional ArsR family regulator